MRARARKPLGPGRPVAMTPQLLDIPLAAVGDALAAPATLDPGAGDATAGIWRERDLDAGVDALARMVALRDAATAVHSDEVARLSLRVGRALGLDAATLATLERAARLHDLGKVAIPDRVLCKAGPLDGAEWALMRHHPAWGAGTVGLLPGLGPVARAVRAHHERWDGGGYPDELRGERIPVESRVIAVCDAYSAMTAERPYAAALSLDDAIGELRACAGRQFDPRVVATLVALVRG